jgi:MFS family permease
LHISVANRQWVIMAYTLAFGGLLLLGGRIADFRGRKRIFIVGLVGFAGASATEFAQPCGLRHSLRRGAPPAWQSPHRSRFARFRLAGKSHGG